MVVTMIVLSGISFSMQYVLKQKTV
jgi:hypothetical protein